MITLYTTGCPRCAVLEKKLQGLGIAYETEVSIEKMQELGIMQAPTLCVDGKMYDFIGANDWLNSVKTAAQKEDHTEGQA